MFYLVLYSSPFVIVFVIIIIRYKQFKRSNSFEQKFNFLVNTFLSKTNSNLSAFTKELSFILEQYSSQGIPLTISNHNHILTTLINFNLINETCIHFNNMNQYNQINDESIYLFFTALISNNLYIEEKDASNWVNILNDSLLKGNVNSKRVNEYKDLIVIGKVLEHKSIEAFEMFMHYMNEKDELFKLFKNKKCIPFLCGMLSYIKDNNAISKVATSLPINQFGYLSKEILEIIIKACVKIKSFNIIEQLIQYYQYDSSFMIKCIDYFIEALSKSQNANSFNLCESLFNQYKSDISISSYGIMMTIYSKASCEKCLNLFNYIKSHKSNELSIIPYQIVIKSLIKNNNVSQAIEIFDKMQTEDNIYPDKILYELIIKACIEHKMEKKAYEYLLMSINHNIKLAKFIYEDVIDALNASDIFEKETLLNKINDLIKISNFQHDKALMKKLKNIIEKENSVSSLETRTSYIVGKPSIELLNI